MAATQERSADQGQFLAVGRRDDTGEVVVSRIGDLGLRPKMSEICMRVLLEMGLRDPLVYEFIVMVYAPRRGGAQVVLDTAMLRRFVAERWRRK